MGKGKYMDNFASMSDEEFMDAWTQLGSQAVADKARLSEFSQEHQRRERKKQLAAMDLNPSDAALLQEIVIEGIESQEGVGEPSPAFNIVEDDTNDQPVGLPMDGGES
jgi:hypothetical protein